MAFLVRNISLRSVKTKNQTTRRIRIKNIINCLVSRRDVEQTVAGRYMLSKLILYTFSAASSFVADHSLYHSSGYEPDFLINLKTLLVHRRFRNAHKS